MAFELFQPFIVHMLIYQGFVNNIKAAKNLLKREDPLIWAVLQNVIEKHPVLLNRAPTLHGGAPPEGLRPLGFFLVGSLFVCLLACLFHISSQT